MTKIQKLLKLLRYHKDRVVILIFELFLSKDAFVQHTPDFVTKLNMLPGFYFESNVFFRKERNSLGDRNRWMQFKLLLNIVKDLNEGHYAELGTFRGVTAKIIYSELSNESKLYCFDTFEGFAEKDILKEKEATNLNFKVGHFSNTSDEGVKHYILNGKPNPGNLKTIKGFFPDTFTGLENHEWRFVHLDCDLYEPMLAGLKSFWPKVVPGGIVLIHDYNGTYKGVKKAVDEFFSDKKEVPVPLFDKVGSIVIIKSREL